MKKSNSKDHLVSIIVITYNSSNYVKETLESCKNQTYKNIELIISDDASTDNTIEICKVWLNRNRASFVRTKLIEAEKNTGIAPNLNRGLDETRGEWIKILAGDDYLMPSIIDEYMRYLHQNPSIRILHSNPILYEDNFEENSLLEKKDCSGLRINSPNISAEEQFQILLRSGPIYASTAMIHSSVYDEIGHYDERAPFWEDTPFWIKATNNGIKLHHYNSFLIKYRVRNDSVQKPSNKLVSKYLKSKIVYKYIELRKYYPIIERIAIIQNYLAMCLVEVFGNKRNIFNLGILYLTSKLNKILTHSFMIKCEN